MGYDNWLDAPYQKMYDRAIRKNADKKKKEEHAEQRQKYIENCLIEEKCPLCSKKIVREELKGIKALIFSNYRYICPEHGVVVSGNYGYSSTFFGGD